MNAKAAVFTGVGQPMELREFPVLEPGPGAIIVKVALANVCGSDLHIWRGDAQLAVGAGPWVLGHEMTGKVYALGRGVVTDSAGAPLKEGDRVVYMYYAPCGRCYQCLHGQPSACPSRFPSWWLSASTPPHFNGAFAELYYLTPGQAIFKVPDELPDEVVAPANCALSQMVFSLHQVGVKWGDTVVIQGAGGLGVYATALAKDMGAHKVVVMDRVEERLNLAKAFGADETINVATVANPRQRIGRVRELTDGVGADVVVEVTGSPQVVAEGITMVRQGGSYLWVGNINRGKTLELDPSLVVMANRRLVGVATYEAWALRKGLDFLLRNRQKLPFERILSHKYPLEEINRAFEESDRGLVTRAALVI